MPLIRPFAGLRPVPEHAADVVAPPYDVLNSEEARERARGRPWSFLHISKAEIDLPGDTDPYDPAVYAKSAENLKKMLDQGILMRDDSDCYYVYRLAMNGHTQTGLVAVASVAEASDPAFGSVTQNAPTRSPAHIPGRMRCFCSSFP